jgi:acyl transferase domain-containing protein
MSSYESDLNGSEIAVIAMAGRFPGALTLEQYWANVRDGVESVRFFSDEELLAAGEDPSLLADPAYVRAWPQLEGIEQFDAAFFGMSPRDASVMDPQHRLFLEVAWEALERAGYSGKSAPLATGVFAAAGMNHYMLYHVVPNKEVMRTVGEWLARHNGNDMNFLATRAAYQMNLKGPAMNVQTACSSSLTAIHLACQSLINRETDLALAGASTLSLPQDRGYVYKPGEILSSDGHCRPFDAGSKGTLFGSGTGCVVLKRLSDAIDDGDTVLAVIRGTAINNDGSQKVGYLAPSVDGQARAVAEALGIAGVPAESIGLIETHGTGTAVGDPIEVEALTQAYAPHTSRRGFIALGSVKANIGHLGEAAGMAGIIKTVLAMQHGQLPPCVNYTAPNPQIDFGSSPFYVNTALAPWPKGDTPRRAGITSLGAGGTNAHLILEEAPAVEPSDAPTRASQLFTVSARTRSALDTACTQLADWLVANPTVSLADAAWTLQQGRVAFSYRRSVTGRTPAAMAVALREPQKGTVQATTADDARVIFMFPGGGAQYATMGRELYDSEPVYRAAFDACLAEMPDTLAGTLRRLVFATGDAVASATTELETPRLALPALFATEYATTRLLAAWGVEPAGMIGHSMGEYVAACLSGVFTLRDALMLVMERARLFETLPAGGMLSVELAEDELLPLLGPELSIAAVNGPALCVASGPVAALDALQSRLAEREIESTRLHISVAAHSLMLEPILTEFGHRRPFRSSPT